MEIGYDGHVELRRGISEHLEAGKVSLAEYAIFVWLLTRAHPFVGKGGAAGVWVGSGRLLAERIDINRTKAQEALNGLTQLGWLKVFPLKNHGTAYMVHKMGVFQGKDRRWINAFSTTDWQNPTLNKSCPYGVDEPDVAAIPVKMAVFLPAPVRLSWLLFLSSWLLFLSSWLLFLSSWLLFLSPPAVTQSLQKTYRFYIL